MGLTGAINLTSHMGLFYVHTYRTACRLKVQTTGASSGAVMGKCSFHTIMCELKMDRSLKVQHVRI